MYCINVGLYFHMYFCNFISMALALTEFDDTIPHIIPYKKIGFPGPV